MTRTRFIQGLIIAVPVLLLGWVLWIELVPTGDFVVNVKTGDRSPYIDRILPDGRVRFGEDGGQAVTTIFDEPAFFFAHPHRGFDAVDVTVRYRNRGASLIELGGLAPGEHETYDLQPLENRMIDDSTWHRLEQDGKILLQRKETFASIADFMARPPSNSELATYHVRQPSPFRLPPSAPVKKLNVVRYPVRGAHQIKTYVGQEGLRFDLYFGNNDSAPSVRVDVFDENGNPVPAIVTQETSAVTVRAAGIPEGVYVIDVHCDDTVAFKTLETTQAKWVWMNRLTLTDDGDPHPINLTTEATNLSFETAEVEGVQDVKVGKTTVSVAQPFVRTTAVVADPGLVDIQVSHAPLTIVADGHIAIDRDRFFNPDPVRLLPGVNLERLGVNYILADYTPPKREGDWYVATAHFDARTLALKDKTWKFAFSIPGIKADQATVDVDSIEMVWHREPFSWSDVTGVIKRIWPF